MGEILPFRRVRKRVLEGRRGIVSECQKDLRLPKLKCIRWGWCLERKSLSWWCISGSRHEIGAVQHLFRGAHICQGFCTDLWYMDTLSSSAILLRSISGLGSNMAYLQSECIGKNTGQIVRRERIGFKAEKEISSISSISHQQLRWYHAWFLTKLSFDTHEWLFFDKASELITGIFYILPTVSHTTRRPHLTSIQNREIKFLKPIPGRHESMTSWGRITRSIN